MIRILLVDDHPVVREGLKAALADEPDFVIVGEADSGKTAVAEASRLRPDVVVLDAGLPDLLGVEACAALNEILPEARVVLLSCGRGRALTLAATAVGAHGVVLKESQTAVLRQAIREVAEGRHFIDPRVSVPGGRRKTAGNEGPFGFTVQELRVIERLPLGLTNREIGEELNLSEATVKVHLRKAREKLSVGSRAELTAIAVRDGLA
ncbi:MAG: response regulator [Actinomycetota bacterium]